MKYRFVLQAAPLAMFSILAQACGAAVIPPPELVNARAAYSRAAAGPAAQLDPAELHEARTALERANNAANDAPDAPETADLSVVAQLKAERVEAQASIIAANQQKAQAQKDLVAVQQSQLAGARGDARNANDRAQAASADASKTREQLEAERQKRMELEKKLQDALATLAKIASIKDTDRGIVITLQGEVLFKTGESKLKAEAMLKLDQIAETLRGQERKMVVEGHTDNQGGAGSYNQDLSEKRAAAVRDYLVTKGIPSDMIRSVGYGPSKPVAENTSPEGRAANRRVEIVVEPRTR
jgi:outer membrane protein OmpA-like peptidoglycan-associated protein